MNEQETIATYERNILACWESRSEQDDSEGLNWYRLANVQACLLAERIGQNPNAGAGILAALSPGNSWERNVSDAWLLVDEWKNGARGRKLPTVGVYGRRNRDKAIACLRGKDPARVLGGDKVLAFYESIASPEGHSRVCVDRHARAIAHGGVRGLAEDFARFGRAEYRRVATAYTNVAAKLGIPPSHLQAVTWVSHKRKKIATARTATASS